MLPRHPPNALIALDLIRKKKDPLGPSGDAAFCAPASRRFRIACILFPPLPKEGTLVSVLDLDNAAVGRHDPKTAGHASPTRDAPTTLIISLNDVKWIPQDPGVRQDETEPQDAV